jgi:hypothetical protein
MVNEDRADRRMNPTAATCRVSKTARNEASIGEYAAERMKEHWDLLVVLGRPHPGKRGLQYVWRGKSAVRSSRRILARFTGGWIWGRGRISLNTVAEMKPFRST